MFLKENTKLFGLNANLDNLSFTRVLSASTFKVIEFQEFYNQIPVYGGQYLISVTDDGRILSASGRHYRKVKNKFLRETSSRISETQAKNTALQFVGLSSMPVDVVINKYLYPDNEKFRLVYFVGLENWWVVVDAISGAAIEKTPRHEMFNPAVSTEDVDARVYLQYPTFTNETGGPLAIKPIKINKSLGLDDERYIKATSLRLGDAPANQTDYKYTPPDPATQTDNTHFDDANVFYHIQLVINDFWKNRIGFDPPFKVRAEVHHVVDNSQALYSQNKIIFGQGIIEYFDMAKSSDVIYHEYAHMVTEHLAWQDGSRSLETRALSEGYSDYFACTFSSDPWVGEWIQRVYQHSSRSLVTDPNIWNYTNFINSPYSYPNYPGPADGHDNLPNSNNSHKFGMVWSGALWDLRTALGPTITDQLVFHGLEMSHSLTMSMYDAREGLIMADYALYSGIHANTIRIIMANRGIGNPPLSVYATGNNCVSSQGQYTTLTGYASGGTGVYVYSWPKQGIDGQTITYPVNSCPVNFKVSVTSGSEYASFTKPVWYNGGACTCDPGGVWEKGKPHIPTPKKYSLDQNFPNPFNPNTNIRFIIPEETDVKLAVYNILGQEVRNLIQGTLGTGIYDIVWDGKNDNGQPMTSGTYIYVLRTPGYSETKKMTLIK